MSEQRKATEVLLSLESKIDTLINLIVSESLNAKILSNKLNEVMTTLTALTKQANSPNKITVEAVNTIPKIITTPIQNFQPTDPERQIPIFADAKLPETDNPQGFRRTSRPETFIDEKVEDNKFPVQLPKGAPQNMPQGSQQSKPPPGRSEGPEVISPTIKQSSSYKQENKRNKTPLVQNAIPVHQRIVDKSGKSIFLADVELTDLTTGELIHKTRTNGTGKWMATLSVGDYKVVIKKRESLDKTALEAIQDVHVKGDESPLELQTLIIR